MENKHIQIQQFIFFFFSYFLLRSISAADDNCQPDSCGPNEPLIKSPFGIIGKQPYWCGFPGFHLYCNNQNRTIIGLPSSHSYTVNRIDYFAQAIYIDQDFCGKNEINTLNLTGTHFEFPYIERYTFYNCSVQNFSFKYPTVPFPCLNSKNHSVVAVQTDLYKSRSMPPSCKVMKTIKVPVAVNQDIKSGMVLTWFNPPCISCENEGRVGDSSFSHGIPKSAKYGISLGIGVPVSVCIIGVICYGASRARGYSETHHQSADLSSIHVIPRPPFSTGLDRPTIESYPKTVVGESCRLPNDDSACAICLSDYKAKELLRTIPECNHYFHVDCIDEWLKLNATCPVCRNTPESSSVITPCSSTSTTTEEAS